MIKKKRKRTTSTASSTRREGKLGFLTQHGGPVRVITQNPDDKKSGSYHRGESRDDPIQEGGEEKQKEDSAARIRKSARLCATKPLRKRAAVQKRKKMRGNNAAREEKGRAVSGENTRSMRRGLLAAQPQIKGAQGTEDPPLSQKGKKGVPLKPSFPLL